LIEAISEESSKDELSSSITTSESQLPSQNYRIREGDSSLTSNSSMSIEQKFTYPRQQHLHTINEGNSSLGSDSNDDASSNMFKGSTESE